jgi:putative hemolysin
MTQYTRAFGITKLLRMYRKCDNNGPGGVLENLKEKTSELKNFAKMSADAVFSPLRSKCNFDVLHRNYCRARFRVLSRGLRFMWGRVSPYYVYCAEKGGEIAGIRQRAELGVLDIWRRRRAFGGEKGRGLCGGGFWVRERMRMQKLL